MFLDIISFLHICLDQLIQAAVLMFLLLLVYLEWKTMSRATGWEIDHKKLTKDDVCPNRPFQAVASQHGLFSTLRSALKDIVLLTAVHLRDRQSLDLIALGAERKMR